MSGMPHSFGVEQSLLGALIFDNQQIDLVADKLSEASFFAEQHIIVWRALNQIRLKGGIADANTLLEFFERENQLKKIGGEQYLAQTVNRPYQPDQKFLTGVWAAGFITLILLFWPDAPQWGKPS